eukprot:CAMPEP_0175849024 /NCGR_PEP_ID=MMETSP0107_2-20121207/24261_1 /TAXON_ID=195067 ORGANISM="Goniomonas pacifica, Strain CCMP1869" /NCGR_SAMPLE_ID=MMETSP0107_2 /ASSEMBLY_ACC=CAM_ASM_000203 /LENGTH=415 /DNA_ID=CAMNT_0017164069 /DNA_START=217 /DNA_END=1461 /DNA_ORIENTATION=+
MYYYDLTQDPASAPPSRVRVRSMQSSVAVTAECSRPHLHLLKLRVKGGVKAGCQLLAARTPDADWAVAASTSGGEDGQCLGMALEGIVEGEGIRLVFCLVDAPNSNTRPGDGFAAALDEVRRAHGDAWAAISGRLDTVERGQARLEREQARLTLEVDMLQKRAAPWQDRTGVKDLEWRGASRQLVFCGREAETQRLEESLNRDLADVVWVHGAPGMGKTELVAQFATRHFGVHRVMWVESQGRGTLRQNYAAHAADDTLGEQDRVRSVRRWLNEQRDVLLVLDNVEDCSEIDELVPHATETSARVIVTSRLRPLGGGVEDMLVDSLKEADALQVLGWSGDGAERECAIAIVRELGGLTLALQVARGLLAGGKASSLLRRLRERGVVPCLNAKFEVASGAEQQLEQLLNASLRAMG